MTRKNSPRPWSAGLLLVLCLWAGPVRAQDTPAGPVAWGQPTDGLQVGLRPDQPLHELHPGDVLAFSLRVRNVGAKPIEYTVRATDHPDFSLAAGNRLRMDIVSGQPAVLRLAPGEETVFPRGTFRVAIQSPGSPLVIDLSIVPATATLVLAPGRYTLQCPEPIWITDKANPGAATAHHAHAGVLTFTVAGPAPPVPTTASPDIQWGEAVDGLQAGLSRAAPALDAAPHDLAFTYFLRNTTNRPLTISVAQDQPGNWSPIITDAQGKPRPVRQVFFDGFVAMKQTVLPPGQFLTIGHPRLRLQLGTTSGEADAIPTLTADPGTYRMTLAESVRFPGFNDFDILLMTGPITLQMPAP